MNYFFARWSRIGQVTFLLLASVPLSAQSPGTGAVSGTVTDPSGEVLSKARVSVVNDETKATRAVLTSLEGVFRVSLLPPGVYSVSAEAVGSRSNGCTLYT
jgi:hypothetical protein